MSETKEDLKPASLETMAGLIRDAAHAAWSGTLIGTAPRSTMALFERMMAPVVGDWVFERSTVGIQKRDLDAVGLLEEIAWEPVNFGEGAEPWDEAEQGRPHPTERVWYIRTLDGYRYRWTNADMLAVPSPSWKLS